MVLEEAWSFVAKKLDGIAGGGAVDDGDDYCYTDVQKGLGRLQKQRHWFMLFERVIPPPRNSAVATLAMF
jgi:hypothetical protein